MVFLFLSTLSLRRATTIRTPLFSTSTYFYPRSPCGERPRPIPAVTRVANFYPRSPCGERPPRAGHCRGCDGISIHALLAESDAGRQPVLVQIVEFLSTLSLRRATYAPLTSELHCLFLSTLSLRRATHPGQPVRGMPSHFYPRSPCGERRSVASVAFASVLISIHTLLAESDTTRLW